MLYHLASHLSTLGERSSEESECEESEIDESESEECRVTLSYSQRDLVAQEVDAMHQVSYSSFVSTFCRNEIKEGIIRVSNSIFLFPFLFQKKNGWPPLSSMSFSLEIFHSPPPPHLNHSREKQ